MASIYKVKKKGGGYYPQWRYKFKDSTGKWIRGIGWTDKAKTRDHALNVEAEHRALRNGEKVAPPAWLRNRNVPIGTVIADYLAWGKVSGGIGGRPWSPKNARLKEKRLEWWTNELRLSYMLEIDLVRVEKGLETLRKSGLAPKSVYLYLEAIKSLVNWSITRSYLGESPLMGMAEMDERPQDPHRAFTEEETVALLKAAPEPRLTWYETALESGYRVGELRALKVQDFDRFGPSLPLGADYTKNRKDARQPITRALADKLEKLAAGKKPCEPLLGIPSSHAWKKIKIDIGAAGIAPSTGEGKATWHSLRKVYVNNLYRTGADLKTVMELARHSSAEVNLTTYASSKPALLREAAEAGAEYFRGAVADAEACRAGVAQTADGNVNPDTAMDKKCARLGSNQQKARTLQGHFETFTRERGQPKKSRRHSGNTLEHDSCRAGVSREAGELMAGLERLAFQLQEGDE